MGISEEFAKEHSLNETQVSAINDHYKETVIPNLKKEWDGLASKNADKILDDVGNGLAKGLKIDLKREEGEKYQDYINRVSSTYFSKKDETLKEKQAELEEKLKNFKGDEATKAKLEDLQKENDRLLQENAKIGELSQKAEQFEGLSEANTKLKRQVAFGNVKPSFPETVNKYEADAKWNAFIGEFDKKYNLEFNEDGKPVGVDKNNKYTVVPLEELVKKNEELQTLLTPADPGQKGTGGAKPGAMTDIEGVPFKVPANATSQERNKAIRDYLTNELKLSITSTEYSKKFAEYNTKILAPKKTEGAAA